MVGLSHASKEVQQAFTAVPRKIRWKNDQRKRPKRKNTVRTATASLGNQDAPAASEMGPPSQPGEVTNTASNGYPVNADEVDEVIDHIDDQALVKAPNAFVVPWIAPINSQTRMLMSHCELYIFASFEEHLTDS